MRSMIYCIQYDLWIQRLLIDRVLPGKLLDLLFVQSLRIPLPAGFKIRIHVDFYKISSLWRTDALP